MIPVLAQTEPVPTPFPDPAGTDLVTEVATPVVDWGVLTPLVILAAGAVVLLMITSLVKRSPTWTAPLFTAVAATAAGLSTVWLWHLIDDRGSISTVGGVFASDRFSLVLTGVICASTALAALLAWQYVPRVRLAGVEFSVLMLLSAAGGVVMVSATDLIVLFLGLEILSIAVYVLAALDLRRAESQEAGIKYFVLGAFSSAFLLYGIAFVYGATGSTNLIVIRDFLAVEPFIESGYLVVGFALLLVGLGFKIAAVPFHQWTPDVYQGSPSPAVAFMASAVKVAAFAAIVRVFLTTFDNWRVEWQPVIWVLALLSLLVGSIAATLQSDVKRMLAYLSISHAGFILLGVQAATDQGSSAVVYYLIAYAFMVIGSFGVATVVSGQGRGHDLDAYRGLAVRSPLLAGLFTVFLLGQAGVPFTTGFLAKYGVLAAAADARSYWLALAAMITAVIAAFAYLRIVVTMFMAGDEDDQADGRERLKVPGAAIVALSVCALFTIGFGVFPEPIEDLADDAVPRLVPPPEPDGGGPAIDLGPIDQLPGG